MLIRKIICRRLSVRKNKSDLLPGAGVVEVVVVVEDVAVEVDDVDEIVEVDDVVVNVVDELDDVEDVVEVTVEVVTVVDVVAVVDTAM